jgi:hypothetical protein
MDSVGGTNWLANYPPTNQCLVESGRLFLTATNGESIRHDFPNAYFNGSLYSRMVVNFSQLPSGNGDFFAFFRVTDLDNLRARIWASTNGAAPGRFRLGITTIFPSPVMIAQDLYLGTNYTLVTRYTITNNFSTLWINPTDEADTANRADDFTTVDQAPIRHYGFSQIRPGQAGSDHNIGALTADDLRIGRTFSEVLPGVKFTSISNAPAGGMKMQASGQATTNYIFQATTNFASTNWMNLSTNAAGTNGLINLSDPDATNFTSRFYRLWQQ